jgi:hypothetical protein
MGDSLLVERSIQMSEVNPFESTPLVEWENCVTRDELCILYSQVAKRYDQLKWYNWITKLSIASMLLTLEALYYWLLSQKQDDIHFGGKR